MGMYLHLQTFLLGILCEASPLPLPPMFGSPLDKANYQFLLAAIALRWKDGSAIGFARNLDDPRVN